jgi:phenylacetate-CoA ligase
MAEMVRERDTAARFFDEKMETMEPNKLRELQLERLKRSLQYAYDNVVMYKNRFDELGIQPGDMKTPGDISRFPFTVKDDLRDNYPFGLFAVPMKEIVRIHASSGTTGRATVVGYTKDDLDMWAQCMARLIVMSGGSCDDIAQITFGYGLFTGALGLHYGLEKVGAAVVPTSSGNTERQIQLMKDFGTTLLIGTPSYGLIIAETMERMGISKDELNLKIGMFGSEPATEGMREELEKRLGLTATDNYGLSEIIGPGVAGECLYKNGQHINEDHFYVEIINPETGESLPDGEKGEVVITTMTKQGIPMIRYRTHDISRIIPEACPCGRTMRRLEKILYRSDDMLIIRGVNVYPSQIEEVLLSFEGIGPQYEIIVDRVGYRDTLQVNVELKDGGLLEHYSMLEGLKQQIHDRMRSALQVDAKINLVSPNTVKRFEGKSRRVTDLRKL